MGRIIERDRGPRFGCGGGSIRIRTATSTTTTSSSSRGIVRGKMISIEGQYSYITRPPRS